MVSLRRSALKWKHTVQRRRAERKRVAGVYLKDGKEYDKTFYNKSRAFIEEHKAEHTALSNRLATGQKTHHHAVERQVLAERAQKRAVDRKRAVGRKNNKH